MSVSPLVWRDKTKVLCIFRYTARVNGSTVEFDDSLMIEVEFADQILETFEKTIALRRRNGWAVGPMPQSWELTGWVSQYPFELKKTLH